jgi:hypothetical protein
VAGLDCWDSAGTLTAQPGPCVTSLPEKANRLRICLASGTLLALTIDGDEYGPQVFDAAVIGCDSESGGEDFDLYDKVNPKLVVACVPLTACVLRLR